MACCHRVKCVQSKKKGHGDTTPSVHSLSLVMGIRETPMSWIVRCLRWRAVVTAGWTTTPDVVSYSQDYSRKLGKQVFSCVQRTCCIVSGRTTAVGKLASSKVQLASGKDRVESIEA